jgi:hypothetical protein
MPVCIHSLPTTDEPKQIVHFPAATLPGISQRE